MTPTGSSIARRLAAALDDLELHRETEPDEAEAIRMALQQHVAGIAGVSLTEAVEQDR